MRRFLSRSRFLAIAGAFPSPVLWFALVCVAVALERSLNGEAAPQLLYFYLVSIPILAGTGLVDVGREGRLDLLLANGASRETIWLTAFLRAVVLHVGFAVLIAALAGRTFSASPIVAALIISLGNGAIGFAGGSVRPAIGFGFVWLACRIFFVLIPAGASLYAHVIEVDTGRAPAVLWKLFVAALFLPEFTLRKNLPASVAMFFLAVAALSVAASLVFFRRAQFTGKRRS